jgi:hypothetical protein
MDLTDRVDNSLCMRAQCPNFGTNREGFASDRRADILNFTTNLSGTGSWQPRPWLNLKSTAGMQYGSFELESNVAQGNQLPPGARTADDGAIPSVTTNTILQKTVGLFVEEVVALNDRLFLTAALRTDQNSAFGTNFQRVYYPKASLSWIASDEGFFPQIGWINQFRLRAAVGASGVQPGPNDADRTLQTEIMRDLSEELRITEERFVATAQHTVRQRLAEALVELEEIFGFEEDGRTLDVQLRRSDIANLVGTAPESVIRTTASRRPRAGRCCCARSSRRWAPWCWCAVNPCSSFPP